MVCTASDMCSRQRRPDNNKSCIGVYLHSHLGLTDMVTHCPTAAVDAVGLFCGASLTQNKLKQAADLSIMLTTIGNAFAMLDAA